MKKLLLVLAVGAFFSCNSGTSTDETIDSSIEAQKEIIDSTAQSRIDAIDSTADAKKEALDSAAVDTTNN